MTMPRVLRIGVGWLLACGALLSAPIVQAQAYPNKPVKIIVPYPPGGTSDILARAIGQKLTDSLGQTEIVARLSTEIIKILNTPDMKERLAVQGAEVSTTPRNSFLRSFAMRNRAGRRSSRPPI